MAKNKQILVVDDDKDCRAMVRKILGDKGFNVLQSGNGIEAMDLVRENVPDLIILDLMMPRMSGWDFSAYIRQLESTREIPIILLSAKGSAEDVMRGYSECGANYYISKPFSADQLLTGVDLVMDSGSEQFVSHKSCIEKK